MAALIAIIASTIFGVADFFGGMSARRIAPLLTAAITQVVGLAVLLVVAVVAGGSATGTDMLWGVGAGAIGGLALAAFYFALSRGAMSVVAPLSAVSAAIVPVAVGVLLGEQPGIWQWAAFVLALPAIVLISREAGATTDDAAVPEEERATPASNRLGVVVGLAAGVGFGLFLVFITRTSSASRFWPLVASRLSATVLLGGLALGTGAMRLGRGSMPLGSPGVRLALVAGAFDGTSNALILAAGRLGMLVLVGVIAALYPASTIVLARVVLREHLQRHQLAGLALAAVAVVLIAIPA